MMANYAPVEAKFFEGETVGLARRLLGCFLVHEVNEIELVGRIVEVEAYLGSRDPASHAYRGLTERNKAMFGSAGHAYIYFSYGSHYCMNVTAQPEGVGEGVLIRAIEPIHGERWMRENRLAGRARVLSDIQLTNGPGKLVQAMGITKRMYGHDLTEQPLYISYGQVDDERVVVGPRIGISKAVDEPLRFWVKGNEYVSR